MSSKAKIRVAVVGLGAIGSSIGLALRQAGGELEIIGHDRDPNAARQAHKMGAVHKTEWNLIAACEGADLIFLAIPLLGIRDTFKAIAPYLREHCVVTDTATVKRPVINWAQELLPKNSYFVGGNPIVVSDDVGAQAAKPDLFKAMTWCLAPAPGAVSEAIELVTETVTLLGAKPYFIDADEHDSLIAATDHLPLVLAATLLRVITNSPSFREMSRVGGPTLAQATRPVLAEVETARDITLLNKENILRWVDVMEEALRETRAVLSGGDEAQVKAFFAQAQEGRARWLRGEESEASPNPGAHLPSVGSMLFGRLPKRNRAGKT